MATSYTDPQDTPEIDFRVTLRNSADTSEYVIFEVTPEVSESRSVNYKTIDPVHAPGQILSYQNTASRSFNLSGIKLISRTETEALRNLQRLWLLRSWTTPYFGSGTLTGPEAGGGRSFRDMVSKQPEAFKNSGDVISTAKEVGVGSGAFEFRGAPPAVLLLSAYSRSSALGVSPGHINRVPVVIQSLNIPYPSDVDYVPAKDIGVPMPSVMTIDITLTESHSPREYERFSLGAYKNGTLSGF